MPRYDFLIVGGGPAGLAALAEVSAVGLRAALVDERVTLGGQIYKQPGPGFEIRDHAGLGRDHVAGRRLIDAAVATGAPIMSATSVVAIRGGVVVLVPEGERATTVEADHVLLAPGAYDRPVAFPGWTLPGVLTAGGMQTLAKTQRVLPGERTVFAGSGPLALAFPAQLQALGADVAAVLEAGPPPQPVDLARMLRAARGNTDLLRDAARYRARLLRARVPLRYRRIVVRAEGEGRVEAVVHAAADRDWRPVPDTEERIVADTLCLGYGFAPSTELLRLAGCAFGHDPERGGHVVTVDGWMRTSVPRVFAAGDGTGVEGAYVAQDEGRLAALGAALDSGRITARAARTAAAPIRRRLRRRRALRAALRRMHAFGTGIDELADAATVVCRCEEVTLAQLDEAVATTADVSVVKGLTRAGMGLCQGRNCQHQVAALVARRHGVPIADVPVATPRSPVRPVPLGAIADAEQEDERFFTAPGSAR